MRFSVEKATSWEQVAEAAALENRCIMLSRQNHDKAKQTFDVYTNTDDVIYYLISTAMNPKVLKGYVRFLCVTSGSIRTWIADFISPTMYEPVVLAARCMKGAVLVKEFACDDDLLAKNWPQFTISFLGLNKYPYHNTQLSESTWKVVNAS